MLERLRTALAANKRKLIVVTVLLSAVILFYGSLKLFVNLKSGAIAATAIPEFCSACHEMRPEYFTWKGSAHSQISCVSCHVKPGEKDSLTQKIKSMVYKHFKGDYAVPIVLKGKIDNSQCLQCHTWDNRTVTQSGDVKFPHPKHLSQKLDCITCHSGVVHGNIKEKGFTALTDFDKWNSKVGAAYVESRFTKLEMAACLECHTRRGAPTTCSTCHSGVAKPPTHLSSDWLSVHGGEALKDKSVCDKCHQKTLPDGLDAAELSTAQYARNNTFCYNCHAKRPPGHTADWRKIHPVQAQADRAACMVCHDDSKPRKDDLTPAPVYCQKCHQVSHVLSSFHPIRIPPPGYQLLCTKCHVARTCENCHVKAKN